LGGREIAEERGEIFPPSSKFQQNVWQNFGKILLVGCHAAWFILVRLSITEMSLFILKH